MVEVFRYITIIVLFIDIFLFPPATAIQGRAGNATFAIIGANLLMWSCLIEVAAHIGLPIIWYRTPIILIGAVLILFYCAEVLKDWER